ncbi:unnamed protein product [Citrullus colocynthis]|uniref:Uncharacterized protein n=1 Tax=Citrullus colocynthis TaxID=252529 RepID=A0ABP0YQ94_9ROSI
MTYVCCLSTCNIFYSNWSLFCLMSCIFILAFEDLSKLKIPFDTYRLPAPPVSVLSLSVHSLSSSLPPGPAGLRFPHASTILRLFIGRRIHIFSSDSYNINRCYSRNFRNFTSPLSSFAYTIFFFGKTKEKGKEFGLPFWFWFSSSSSRLASDPVAEWLWFSLQTEEKKEREREVLYYEE